MGVPQNHPRDEHDLVLKAMVTGGTLILRHPRMETPLAEIKCTPFHLMVLHHLPDKKHRHELK